MSRLMYNTPGLDWALRKYEWSKQAFLVALVAPRHTQRLRECATSFTVSNTLDVDRPIEIGMAASLYISFWKDLH